MCLSELLINSIVFNQTPDVLEHFLLVHMLHLVAQSGHLLVTLAKLALQASHFVLQVNRLVSEGLFLLF